MYYWFRFIVNKTIVFTDHVLPEIRHRAVATLYDKLFICQSITDKDLLAYEDFIPNILKLLHEIDSKTRNYATRLLQALLEVSHFFYFLFFNLFALIIDT